MCGAVSNEIVYCAAMVCQLADCAHCRLAWALVAGGGSWCAEAAARREIASQGAALRRDMFSHLDAWLHANSYSSRTLYAALLDRLKVTTEATTGSGDCLLAHLRRGRREACVVQCWLVVRLHAARMAEVSAPERQHSIPCTHS